MEKIIKNLKMEKIVSNLKMGKIDYAVFKVSPKFYFSEEDFLKIIDLTNMELYYDEENGSIINIYCGQSAILYNIKNKIKEYLIEKIKDIVDKFDVNRKEDYYEDKLNEELQSLSIKPKINNILSLIKNEDNFENVIQYQDFQAFIKGLVKEKKIYDTTFVPETLWHMYDSLWNEYKYRHDMIWKLSFRTITACVVVSILPYTRSIIVGKLNLAIFGLLLLIPIGILVYSLYTINREIELLDEVKKKYRSIQRTYLNIEQEKSLKQGKSGFGNRIKLVLNIILILAVINLLYALFLFDVNFIPITFNSHIFIITTAILALEFIGVVIFIFCSSFNIPTFSRTRWLSFGIAILFLVAATYGIALKYNDYFFEKHYPATIETSEELISKEVTKFIKIKIKDKGKITLPLECFPKIKEKLKDEDFKPQLTQNDTAIKWVKGKDTFKLTLDEILIANKICR